MGDDNQSKCHTGGEGHFVGTTLWEQQELDIHGADTPNIRNNGPRILVYDGLNPQRIAGMGAAWDHYVKVMGTHWWLCWWAGLNSCGRSCSSRQRVVLSPPSSE